MNRALGVSLLTALALSASPAYGQQTGPLVLRLPASTRAAALGDAFVTGSGPDLVFYNPAQIGEGTGLATSVARYGSASTLGTLGASTKMGRFGVALGVQWLGYRGGHDAFPAPPGTVVVRGPDPASTLAATLAASTRLIGFRWGLAAKYLEERLPTDVGSGPAFDLGVAREVGRFTLGLAAQNLGPALAVGGREAELPTRVGLGAGISSVPLGTWFDLVARATVSWERELGVVPAGGLELRYLPVEGWTIAGRVGARRVDRDGRPAPSPLTFGGTLGLDRVELDYAYEPFTGSGGGHRIGLRIR